MEVEALEPEAGLTWQGNLEPPGLYSCNPLEERPQARPQEGERGVGQEHDLGHNFGYNPCLGTT